MTRADDAGTPHVQFRAAMEGEHCLKAGCNVPFTTTNYHITTTPLQEWGYTIDGKRCPDSDMLHDRRMPDIEELLKLPLVKAAKLSYEEVGAVVLYTGPMVCHPTVHSSPS